eukprot:TRINITY_DN6156_c0_g2_i2.p1 TRINITY_DN6156_c0_g2~~TRINITY_DN6156_c0_g2_i2.p1  ORF type:complete len:1025 (-),score=130.01 TRINITY_DN6156_c0_g2_i2:29-3103(-)
MSRPSPPTAREPVPLPPVVPPPLHGHNGAPFRKDRSPRHRPQDRLVRAGFTLAGDVGDVNQEEEASSGERAGVELSIGTYAVEEKSGENRIPMSLPDVPSCFPSECRDNPKIFYCCSCFCPTAIVLIVILSLLQTLGPQEQMVITTANGSGRKVRNGPDTFLLSAGLKRFKRSALILTPLQYAKVKNSRKDPQYRIIEGPQFLWLEGWDELMGIHDKLVLKARDYTRLIDSFTGKQRVEIGPQRIVPGVYEKAPNGIETAILLKKGQSVVVQRANGSRHMVTNVSLYYPAPKEQVIEVRSAVVVKNLEYAIIKHERNGKFRHEGGPARVILGAYEKTVEVRPMILLQKNEYVKLVDNMNGNVRILRGPDAIVPEPTEVVPKHVSKAIVIGSQNGVVVRNRATGKRTLVREEGIFFPSPEEDILSQPNAIVLKSQEFAVVQQKSSGNYTHWHGPLQLFLNASDILVKILPKVVLQNQQYVRLLDYATGEEVVYKGPETIVPSPGQCEKDYKKNCVVSVEQAVVMRPETSVLVRNARTGVKKVVKVSDGDGGIYTPQPYEAILKVNTAVILLQTEYARVKNLDGTIRNAMGPLLLHLEVNEELLNVALKVVLAKFNYIRLVDAKTGGERIVEGPIVFVPNPTEESVRDDQPRVKSKQHNDMVQQSTLIDQDHALLVNDQSSGVQRLETTQGMWTPRPYEYLLEKRDIVRVLPHQAVIVRTPAGELIVHDGTKDRRGIKFFLEPRTTLEEMLWTEDPSQNSKKVVVMIDMRIHRMPFHFNVRTSDHVDFEIMGNMYWRVQNVSLMIRGTKDPAGDVWHHVKSSLMQSVSAVSFDGFMGSFNTLANVTYAADTAGTFYTDRGIEVKRIEVTRFEAVDADTRLTLQRINAEVTQQITMLRQQEGQSIVNSARLNAMIALQTEQTQGELELESEKTKLIAQRTSNELLENTKVAIGTAQRFALHAKMFIEAMNQSNVSTGAGMQLYRALKKAELHNNDTQHLFGPSSAKLFLTSGDVSLNVRDLGLPRRN